MVALSGFTLKSKLFESPASLVYRAIRRTDQLPVVLKVLRRDYPSPQEIARYQQEYAVLRSLSSTSPGPSLSGVIRVYDQIPYNHTYVIVCEDFGGEALSHWMRQWPQIYSPMQTAEWLQLAIKLTDNLSQIHSHQVIHKDINPSNIVLNPATGQVKLIDFGIATQLTQTELCPNPPSQLEGTLAYLSPEQTGRMNRPLDYRTDFYSLGVTFYHLLTGRLPFPTDDMLELVHCHLAKSPVPPIDLNPTIPPLLSDLVLKLMAKDADDRYQSAAGIQVDLERCLQTWQASGTIAPFPLAQQDFTGQLQVPQKLYGRSVDVARLLAAFERIAEGQKRPPELILITGYSGIGKSSLVRELYRPITARRGYFISGKFDQYQRRVPYTAVVSAFTELVRQLLVESEADLQRWRDRIQAAVGSNGQVITKILPDVERIIGVQPSVPQLGAMESQNRFHYVFQNFVRVFCTPEHPLTLFLDDLQWADQASLNLLRQVLMDGRIHHLLVLGAYRNNEVDERHPLSATLQTLSEAGVRVQTLTLMPLGITHLGQLLSDTLHQPVESIAELTGLVMQKTTGNPFFVTQFLKTLYSQEFLAFNSEQRCWQWDVDRIQAADYTDNVVALMAADIQRLPPSTRQFLQLAACIGTEFELSPLEMLTDRAASTFLTDLAMATAKGLLISSGGQRSYWQTNRYRFVHDQIQQTVYEMGSAEQHQQIHLRLGQWLWEQVADAEAPEGLFEMVDHLNLGLLNHQRFTAFSWAERQQWAELNLKAGKKAKESMAYLAAADYLKAGLTLLGAIAWEQAYPLVLALHEEAAETAYLSGDFDRMDRCINVTLDHTLEPLDRVRSYDIRIQALASQGKLQDAIASGLTILNELGIHLPQHPTALEGQAALVELNALLADWSTQDLLALPEMTNSISLGLVQILARIGAAAFISAPNLLPFIFLKIFELSLQFGNTPGSTIGYLGYALILCGNLGEIERGYQFGQLAAEIVTKLEARQFQAKVCNVLGGHILFWKDPLLSTIPTLLAGYQSGQETGDFEYAGYTLRNIVVNTYFSGKPLPEVLEIIETQIRATQRLRQDVAFYWAAVFWQNALNLRDEVENPTLLMGQGYNEAIRIPLAQQQGNYTELHGVYLSKLILNYLLGHFASAIENSNLAGQYLESVTGMIETATYPFYDALAQLALAFPTEDETQFNQADEIQVAALGRVNANQAKLKLWATHAPMNFLHKVHLIEAEKARVLGQVLEAEDYYEQAIAGAKANGYLQDLALAYELAASFYRQRGRELSANAYLKEAHYAYSLWGATVKVQQLEAQFPQVLAESPAGSVVPGAKTTQPSLTSGNMTSQQLDLNAIFQATRAIAGAIEIPRLQSTLLEILLKGAGAQRGYLLLPSETATGQTEWRIEATGRCDIPNSQQREIAVEVLQQLPMADHIPVSLVNYVLHTQKSVVLDDACQWNDFSGDAYLRSHPTRSLLCTPILNRGVPVGLVYLENNLTVGAFTQDRLEMVQLLAGQAAISLSNARLYSQLRDREAQVRQSEQRVKQFLDAIPVGISIFDSTGHFAYQNLKAQELQGMVATNDTTVDQLTEVFQVYKADTDQPYPTAKLPVVRALAGETTRVDDMELRRGDQTLPLEVSATPILNDLGDVLYAIAAFDDITDRKQAQKLLTDYSRTLETQVHERTEALTRQWEMLQTLVNQIPTMLVFYDPGGDLILVNRAVEEITGWSIVELSQTAWLAQIYPDPDYRQEAWEHWEAADGTWLDRTLRCRDGHFIETTWAHIRLSDGRKIGIGRDITERKRMEESLRSQAESERLLATITQHIRQSLNLTDILNTTVVEVQRNLNADRVLILKFSDDGVVRVIQATAIEVYLLPDTLDGMPDCALKDCYDHCLQGQPRIFSSADATSCLESLMQSLGVQSEVVAPIIYLSNDLNTPSQAYIWGLLMVQSCRSPRQWQDSEADFLQQISNQLAIAIYQSDLYYQLQAELKERRQTEMALRQSQARLTAAQAIACMGDWELEVATGSMIWSEQLFEIAALPSDRGAPGYGEFLAMCHPEDREPLNQHVIAAVERGIPYRTIFRFIRPDHALRYIESRGEAALNDRGEVIRVFGTAQDISERYEIDRLKDEFIGMVSHELRTPMTAIQSSLIMLSSGAFDDDPDQASQMLRIAQNNTDRLVRLVNDILDLERLESGKVQLTLEPCPMAHLIQQSIETIQPLADQAQLQLLWEPDDAMVLADPDAIIQTLTNLLSNAIKFSEPGHTVVITTSPGDHTILREPTQSTVPEPFQSPSPQLLISVTDYGRGIPADKLKSIFNRFQQVDALDARQKGGTGLGLTICKNIVEKHGGQIWAESELGDGSCFSFTLPLWPGDDRMGQT